MQGVSLPPWYDFMRFSVTLFKVFISPHHQPNAFLAFGWIDDSIDLEPARDRMFVSILEYRDRMFYIDLRI